MPRPVIARSLDRLPGIRHGFFGREGGESDGLYASLNCGLGSKDDRAHVIENRRRVAGRLGDVGMPVVTLYQTHSATALTVTGAVTGDLPKADGVVTRTPGVVVGALAADCCPILYADPVAKVVAAAHAGWRGAVAGIAEATVERMIAEGAERARIVAAIGPCIGPAAYEVGPEFEAELLALTPANAAFFHRADATARPHFDLPAYVVSRLSAIGLAHVENASICTYENESRFFSYRRATHRKEPDYGRQISAIVVA